VTERFRRALVTGGAGFIGARLVRGLLDRGLDVTVLDNLSVGTADRVDPRARLVTGDIRRTADLAPALEGVDCVFHLAARVAIRASVDGFVDDADTNLMGTVTLLSALDPMRVGHFTLASSMAVYAEGRPDRPIDEEHLQEPISPYGVSKWAAERIAAQVLAQKGIRCTVTRYFNTFGPGQTYTPYVGVVTIFATRLLNGEPIVIFGDGEQTRDFVHVDDIVSGTIATLDGPTGIYNLGTGRGTTVNEVARLLVSRLAPGAEIKYAAAQPGELRCSIADIERARKALGYEPSRSLATGLDDVLADIKDRASRRK
jgi:UDP-glucose 4-epimerase